MGLRDGLVAEDLLQPRVVVDELLGRRGHQIVELVDIHLERQRGGWAGAGGGGGRGAGRRVGGGGRVEQRRRQVVGDHVLAEQERALLQVRGEAAFDGDEHEGASVADEALLLQSSADRRCRVTVLDDEFDLGRVAGTAP